MTEAASKVLQAILGVLARLRGNAAPQHPSVPGKSAPAAVESRHDDLMDAMWGMSQCIEALDLANDDSHRYEMLRAYHISQLKEHHRALDELLFPGGIA